MKLFPGVILGLAELTLDFNPQNSSEFIQFLGQILSPKIPYFSTLSE